MQNGQCYLIVHIRRWKGSLDLWKCSLKYASGVSELSSWHWRQKIALSSLVLIQRVRCYHPTPTQTSNIWQSTVWFAIARIVYIHVYKLQSTSIDLQELSRMLSRPSNLPNYSWIQYQSAFHVIHPHLRIKWLDLLCLNSVGIIVDI